MTSVLREMTPPESSVLAADQRGILEESPAGVNVNRDNRYTRRMRSEAPKAPPGTWLRNACRQAGITFEEYLALFCRFPVLHAESERIERELDDSEKESAYLSAIRWAQEMPNSQSTAMSSELRAYVDAAKKADARARRKSAHQKTHRVFVILLGLGLLVADSAALAMFIAPAGFKYFGFVLVGLVSATIGGLGLFRREPTLRR